MVGIAGSIVFSLAMLVYNLWMFGWYRGPGSNHKFRWNSPDADMYMAMSRQEPVPSPCSRRWLLPSLLTSVAQWQVVTGLSLVGTSALLASWGGPVAGLLFATLAFFRINACLGVTPDAFAIFLVTLSGYLGSHGSPTLSVIAGVLSGCVKESAPLFAFALCGNPLVVFGVLGADWSNSSVRPPSWLKTKISDFHGLDILTLGNVLPWAAPLAVAIYFGSSLRLIASLVLSYSQLLVATDKARLYMWAAPAVCLAAACAPEPWGYLAVVVSLFMGYRGI